MLNAVILKIFPQDDKKYILKITYILICMEKYSVKMIKIHIKNILSNHIFSKYIYMYMYINNICLSLT
jgi:hypothetical protein